MTDPAAYRLYDDLAWLWPLLSPPEDYADEARLLREHIAAHFRRGADDRRLSLLELGAGGGHTLVHLCDDFDCTAVDLSEPMLDNCRTLLGEDRVRTVRGDMRCIRLERTFDIVLVHDAIDYMTTRDEARAACATIAAHLSPGGIAFVAPTYTRETFTDGEVADDGTTTDADELTYFTYVHDPDPGDDQFEMILLYLIRPRKVGDSASHVGHREADEGSPRADVRGRQVRVVEDRHTCGLFSSEQWVRFLGDAGLTARGEGDAGAWSLFIAHGP